MTNDKSHTSSNPSPAEALKALSGADWASFGLQEVAYLRPVVLNGVKTVSIHAADGTRIGAAPNIELAAAAVVEHEMAPVLVH